MDVLANRNLQDGVFAALIVGTRIPANLGMAGALACLMLSGIYAAIRIEQVRDAVQCCWLQLSFPALALMSVAWAVYPAVTLRAAVQMTLTAFAGLLLSQAVRPRAVLTGLFVVYAGYTVMSLMAGDTRPDGNDGAIALYGLGGEAKNFFADCAATATLLAMTMLAAGIERRTFFLTALSGAATAACAWATLRAHSAGSMAALAVAAALLGVLLILRGRSPRIKLVFVAALAGVLVLSALLFQPLLAMVQELSDKDAGLTGRAYLWYRADFIIAQRPWLGMGYFGFWTPANPDAIGLWRYFDLGQESTGFSFHNSYIQTIVETGYIGVSIMVGCWLLGSVTLLRRFVLVPSLANCFWLSYLALQLSKSPVEPIRPAALIAPTIMLFAALGFGCFPVSRRKAGRAGPHD
jgi:exopolysaccharide production protein ExoQ